MSEKGYFAHLYEIASQLNREFSLHAVLRNALKKTVQLLELETGWIWLVEGNTQTVYLAASYNLPPALSDRPERLSGWCYCIEKYLSDDIDKASNISEITCSRLKDIKAGTRNLKFHATIPIFNETHKIGLLNLLSKESQQLSDDQLNLLNMISKLIAVAIQRARIQEIDKQIPTTSQNHLKKIVQRILGTHIESLYKNLELAKGFAEQQAIPQSLQNLEQAIAQLDDMKEQLSLIQENSSSSERGASKPQSFVYPGSPLSQRELEVLQLVKAGQINRTIAEQLFITERTVKFHISSILSKLHAQTRTEAVHIAIQRGLIDL